MSVQEEGGCIQFQCNSYFKEKLFTKCSLQNHCEMEKKSLEIRILNIFFFLFISVVDIDFFSHGHKLYAAFLRCFHSCPDLC